MDLVYGEKYMALRAEVRAFLQEHGHRAPASAGGWPNKESLPWQQLLLDRGYVQRTVPKEFGGYGAKADPLEDEVIIEEFRAAKIPMGFQGQGVNMLVPMLLEKGSDEQKMRFIPPTIRGELAWCQGYSEPNAGSDLTSLSTRADRDGDHWVINGQKIWTSSANVSDWIFCLVRSEHDKPRQDGITFVLFDLKTPGVEPRRLDTMCSNVSDKGSFNEVFFTDVRVPLDQTVGRPGEGWKVANSVLKFERGSLAPPHSIRGAFEALLEQMREADANGNRPIDNAVYADRLMQFDGRITATEAHDLRMLSCDANQQNPGVGALILKLQGTELMHELLGFGLDVFGEFGLGYCGDKYVLGDNEVQGSYMYNLGLIIGGGTSQVQKNIISERGLGMPREPRGAAK